MPESVWDYPRPPLLERSARRVTIEYGGAVLVDTTDALRVLETSHPPVYYVHASDVSAGALEPSPARGTLCEWKGMASYFEVVGADGRRAERAAWGYPSPSPGYEALRGCVAFYRAAMDACMLDGERVQAQAGDFYGGWITAEIVGPFKGAPGTRGW